MRCFDGELNEYVRTQRARHTATVVDIVRAGVECGQFVSVDSTMTAMHVFGVCNYAWTWFRPDGAKSAENVEA